MVAGGWSPINKTHVLQGGVLKKHVYGLYDQVERQHKRPRDGTMRYSTAVLPLELTYFQQVLHYKRDNKLWTGWVLLQQTQVHASIVCTVIV